MSICKYYSPRGPPLQEAESVGKSVPCLELVCGPFLIRAPQCHCSSFAHLEIGKPLAGCDREGQVDDRDINTPITKCQLFCASRSKLAAAI